MFDQMFTRFLAHGGLERAGSLAYTTLLSLVPLMTVVFAILSAFPVGERVNEVVQEFIFSNFMPASGEVVHRYLLEFSDKASHLSGVSFVVLLVVAVMLVASIDHTFNAIWEVERKRRPLNKFLVYWAVISLGPLLVGASLLITSSLVSLPAVTEATATGFGKRLLGWSSSCGSMSPGSWCCSVPSSLMDWAPIATSSRGGRKLQANWRRWCRYC